MLILERKEGERIRIGKHIWITVDRIGLTKTWVGIDAPPHVKIAREEILPKRERYHLR